MRVRDHDAVEAELLPQQAADDRRGEGGGVARVEGGVEDVGGHDRLGSRGDRGPERREVPVELRPAAEGDHRQRRVAVVGRGAVTGEVLGDRDQARPGRAPQERRAELADLHGVGAERPVADDRAVGPVGEVEHGREVHRDADGGEVLRHEVRGRLDVGRVAGGPRVPRGGELDEGGERAEPVDPPALLVDRDEQADAGRRAAGEGLEAGRVRGELVRGRRCSAA